MNQANRLSPIVIEHIRQLLVPLTDDYNLGELFYYPQPKHNLTPKEQQLFWRYHGHFPQEFVKAIQTILPNNIHFVQYDHLQNVCTLEVK